MYLGKHKFYNPEVAEENRKKVIATKSGAIFNTFMELEGLLNKSVVAKQYFEKSQGWFSQKLHGSTVCDKERGFSDTEAHQLAEALRDIANRLSAHANEIDSAK